MNLNNSLARRNPDLPRWVEARALLLSGDCEIFGLQEEPELSLVVRDPETESIFVIGTPSVTAVEAAIQKNSRGSEVIALLEQVTWLMNILPEWSRSRIIVHCLAGLDQLPVIADDTVGFLDPARIGQLSIEDELRKELESGAEGSLIAATFVDQQPVSFCYAGAITESLWDVSIDTLPEYRRKGYAAVCVTYMIRYMQAEGKHPVWQAEEKNPASWRLAQKLGFVPVDELVLFEPGE